MCHGRTGKVLRTIGRFKIFQPQARGQHQCRIDAPGILRIERGDSGLAVIVLVERGFGVAPVAGVVDHVLQAVLVAVQPKHECVLAIAKVARGGGVGGLHFEGVPARAIATRHGAGAAQVGRQIGYRRAV